jgi:hypothetical protein
MPIRLEIERLSGIDERAVSRDGVVAGKCPGCLAEPFRILTHPKDGDRYGARCVDCNDPVGWVYVEPDTLFGAEEDAAMIGLARGRVYGLDKPRGAER